MMLSLRARLRLGLAVLAAIVALLAIAATASINRLGGAIATILRENYLSVVTSERMLEALERQDSAALFAAVGRADIARKLMVEHRPAFRAAFAVEAGNVTIPGEGELVKQISVEYEEYVREVDRVLGLAGEAQAAAYFSNLLPRFQSIKSSIQQIAKMNQANMEAANERAKLLARRTVNVAIGMSVLVIAFAIWMSIRLPQTLIEPVDDLSRTARAIGEGNLDVKVGETSVRELAPLAEAFRAMLEKLRAYRASSLGELLAAKDLANSTVACMLDPVVVFGADSEILLANDAAEKAFGLQPGTPDELRALEIKVPDAIESARDTVLARGESVLPQTLADAMRWGAGQSERYYLVRAAPLASGEETSGVVVLAQDVTRYRRIDALKSDVVATVSHQFKTPLTSLRVSTHMLLEPTIGPLNDRQREFVTLARDDTERLRTMVDELLDLVRIESEAGALKRRVFDARALFDEVVSSQRATAEAKGVTLELDERHVNVDGDPDRLAIVVSNLVSNAIRHTVRGGRVTLSAEVSDGAVRLIVTDTGEGIAEDDLARIFERSVRIGGEATRDRHGLGLTIAREIVLHHGGDIDVTSRRGEGSRFAIVLPRRPAD